VMPLMGVALAGGAAFWAARVLQLSPPVYLAWLFIPAAAGVALGAAIDLLRQANSSRLLMGIVPDLSFVTVLLGCLSLWVPAGVAWFCLVRLSLSPWLGIGLMLAASLALDAGLYGLLKTRLQRLA